MILCLLRLALFQKIASSSPRDIVVIRSCVNRSYFSRTTVVILENSEYGCKCSRKFIHYFNRKGLWLIDVNLTFKVGDRVNFPISGSDSREFREWKIPGNQTIIPKIPENIGTMISYNFTTNFDQLEQNGFMKVVRNRKVQNKIIPNVQYISKLFHFPGMKVLFPKGTSLVVI